MTRLEKVIQQVKDARKGDNKPWIFDDNGLVKDNILVCEILDVLEELKNYELDVTDEWIKDFLSREDVKGDNTYNINAKVSNDINMNYLINSNGEEIIVIMVHLFGDIRWGYSDYFVVKFEDDNEFYELESGNQSKMINDTMCADMSIFSEWYNVCDCEKHKYIGEFYCLEVEDLLKEIENL